MKNIFIAIIVIVMLPLFFASMTEKDGSQELKGFTARDIQYIESIGFVDNNDGSWTINITGLTSHLSWYFFEYKPYNTTYGIIEAIRVDNATNLLIMYYGGYYRNVVTSMTLWGGDVS